MDSPLDDADVRQASESRGDVSWALEAIAAPVLRVMFRSGEVTAVRVETTGDGKRDVDLTMWVTALGHSGGAVLWGSRSSLRDASLTDLRVHAADQLQDMIAESPDAWGELRTFERSDFE